VEVDEDDVPGPANRGGQDAIDVSGANGGTAKVETNSNDDNDAPMCYSANTMSNGYRTIGVGSCAKSPENKNHDDDSEEAVRPSGSDSSVGESIAVRVSTPSCSSSSSAASVNQSKAKSSVVADSKARLIPCPLCYVAFSKASIEIHAAFCNGEDGVPGETVGNTQIDCPICGRSFPIHLIEGHAATCEGRRTRN
jgi:hypothetical protein